MSIFERAIDIFDIGDEARIIYSETGLTPRQLAEQREELLGALKKCRFDSLNQSIDEWREIQSVITKCESEK